MKWKGREMEKQMPRPQKSRRICGYPDFWTFSPEEETDQQVALTLDEYEAIRLIDFMDQTQEEAARQMQVARTTVTAIYDRARKKMADAIVNGKRIRISGGNYRLDDMITDAVIQKGRNAMRIAVTYENGEIFQHFGHTSAFKLFDIENNMVVNEQVVNTNGQGHSSLAAFLKQAAVDRLICSGIGEGAQNALKEAGIELYGGISGSADAAVQKLLAGTLPQNAEANCNHHHHHDHDHQHQHHHHHDHGAEHKCGAHGCGNH